MSASLPTPPSAVSHAGDNPIFAQAMLRIASPTRSHAFYTTLLQMSLLTRLDFPAYKFSLFFYAYIPSTSPPSQSAPQSQRAAWLWSLPCPTVELTWNWPADTYDESRHLADEGDLGEERYVSGNDPPTGFAHIFIAVNHLDSLLASTQTDSGVNVVSPVETDPLTGLKSAIVADPDGYHIRLTERRSPSRPGVTDAVFAGVKLRVQDPRTALPFFSRLGFKHVARIDEPSRKATQYYLAYSSATGAKGEPKEVAEWVVGRREPLLQLEHAWGVEEQEEKVYVNGNVKPYRGFGHVGIVVDDIYKTVQELEGDGYAVVRKPGPFADVGDIAFVAEPSAGYWVEVIKREGEPGDVPYEQPVLA